MEYCVIENLKPVIDLKVLIIYLYVLLQKLQDYIHYCL